MHDPVTIARLQTIQEFRHCELLQLSIWGADPVEVSPADLLMTIHRHGGLVLGAFDAEARMIGFLFGFPGITGADNPAAGKPGQLHHCSHALGVIPEWQGKGVGFRLKLAQRDWLLQQGTELVTWTFDPLESANAILNIGKLGAVSRCYLRDLYGTMPDALNAGMPSDRLEVAWRIKGLRVHNRVVNGWQKLPAAELLRKGIPIVNPAIPHTDQPCEPGKYTIPGTSPVLAEIPYGIQSIKRRSNSLAKTWRMSIREVLESLFSRGYEIDDLVIDAGSGTQRIYYLLRNVAPEQEFNFPPSR